MKPQMLIRVADRFPFPAGRHRDDGPQSGEAFREDVLVPALREADVLVLDLDGIPGLPSSFLDEAFGGLVRINQFLSGELERRLEFRVLTPRMRIYPEIIQSKITGGRSPIPLNS